MPWVFALSRTWLICHLDARPTSCSICPPPFPSTEPDALIGHPRNGWRNGSDRRITHIFCKNKDLNQ
jgi:hypothetical protein